MHRIIEEMNQQQDTRDHSLKTPEYHYSQENKQLTENRESRWILVKAPVENMEIIRTKLLQENNLGFIISLDMQELLKIKGKRMHISYGNYFLLQVYHWHEIEKIIEEQGCELVEKYDIKPHDVKKTHNNPQWFLIQCTEEEEDKSIDMITKHSNYGGNFGGDFIKLNAINNNSKKKLEQPEMFKGYILLSLVDNMQAIEILKSVSAKVIKKYTQERLFTKEDRGDFHWFLLRCRGGTENKVIEHIEKHPLHSENFKNEFIQLVEYEKRNVNKIKGINMFAGYFLVEMRDTQEARLILRGCRTSIIKQYTEANVQELISKILEEEKLTTNKDFQVKEEVIVNTSIFSGEGVIISINEEKQRAMVQFYYFGAYNTISVPFTDLEKKRKTKEVKYKPKPKY